MTKVNEQDLGSNRSFGILFSSVFALLAGLNWWRGGRAALPLLGFSAASGLVALLRPQWLAPLNKLWMRLALLLNRVVSPVVLAVLYFAVMTPFGLMMRAFGRDPMRRRFEPATASYWIRREPPGPPPESLREQF
jgi:hypothetical protein